MKIIESPREAMQGFHRVIPTAEKVRYLNHLLRSGFDTVEVGSYVSPRLIPQMADSLEVIRKLDLSAPAKRMFLAVNKKGAEVVAGLDEVTHISFPFSFSPTFLRLNVNSTVEESFGAVETVVERCANTGKEGVIYISMAFGNPYGDAWSEEMLCEWVGRLHQAGVRTIALSNVSTEVTSREIGHLYNLLIPQFPEVEFGLHLHTANEGWHEKVESAWSAGCRRFDGVMNGWGGCPMANKELLGNLKTENLVAFMTEKGVDAGLNRPEFSTSLKIAGEIFSS